MAAAATGASPDGLDRTVDVLKALANPTRLQIMNWLESPDVHFAEWEPIADRDEFGVCVSHLQAKSGLAQSTVSAYMATLERAGLVRSTRIGKWIHYKRNDDAMANLTDLLQHPCAGAADTQ